MICALLFSCASHSVKPTAVPPGTPAADAGAVPTEIRVGVVRAVGADQRFVLIETPSALATSSLSEGQLLHCRPPGASGLAATADLRVSRERHQSLVAANVLAGDPAVGAVVYATSGEIPTPAPAPGSISSVSTAPLPGLFPPRNP